MFKEVIQNIRKFATKASTFSIEYNDAIEQQGTDQKRIIRLQEKFLKFWSTDGTRALLSIRKWANREMDVAFPESFIAELDLAIELLMKRNLDDAHWRTARATIRLARDVDYNSMPLQEAAVIASLISALEQFSDAVSASSEDQITRPGTVMAQHALGVVAKQGGTIDDLVPVLTNAFWSYNRKLRAPRDVLVSELKSLLPIGTKYSDLSGICIAIWAVTHGQLIRLNDAILFGVASLYRHGIWNFDNNTRQNQLEN